MTVTLKSKDGQAIRKFIPLTTLPESAFNKLCAQIRIEEGTKGTVLFKQGDQKNEFVYLIEGTISLQAAGMEMDTISGGSEEARFALAHQIPRKVFAVAQDKIRFIRVNAEVLNSTTSKQRDSVSYEVSDMPEESSGDWMTTLLKSPIFQRLPAANLQKVLTSMEEIEVNAGELVVKQGESGDYYYIIKKGRCSLTRKPSKNAKEIKLAELKTTDTFGEDSLISGAPRNVNITMLTDGILLRLSKENFLELVKKPVIQTLPIDRAINAAEAGAVLLDVRTPDNFEHGHLEGSRNVPFFSLRMQIANLDPTKKLIVICEDGNTSEAACFLLIRYAFDAVVLEGGFNTVPERYLAPFHRNEPLSAGQSSPDTVEATPIALAADEIQALEEARQIIAQLQKQLWAEQEKRKTAERDHIKPDATQEIWRANELELQNQIAALNSEIETAKKAAEDYRLRLEEAENSLTSSKQATATAAQESDDLKSELTAKIETLQSKLDSRQTELEKALIQSADDKKRMDSLNEKIRHQEKHLSDLSTSVQEKSSKLEKEISTKNVIEANLSRIQKETSSRVVKLAEKADKAEQTIAELQQQLAQSRQSCALLEKQNAELAESQSGKVESLLGEKQAFEKEAADLKHRVEQISEEKQRLESEAKDRIAKLQENLGQLEQQIIEKNQDLGSMQHALRDRENLARELEIRIDQVSDSSAAEKKKLQGNLQQQEDVLKESREFQEKQRKEIAQLEERLDKGLREQENAKAEQNSLKQEIARLESQKKDLECAKSGMEETLADKASKTEALERELLTAASRISDLESRISDLSRTIETTTVEFQSTQDELKHSQQSCKEFQEALEQLSAKHENATLDAEIERNALLNKIADLERSLEESGNELKAAKQSELASESNYSSAIEEISQLKQYKSELETKFADLKDNVRQKDQDLESTQKKLTQLQKSEAGSQQKLEELSAQYEQSVLLAENVKSDLQEQVEALQNTLSLSTADLEETRKVMQIVTHERDNFGLEKEKLEAENAALTQDLESLVPLNQQLTELRNLSEKQQEELERLEETHSQKISTVQARQAELEEENAALNAENSEIQERMANKVRDLSAMEEKIFAIRKENAVLQRRLDGFRHGNSDFATSDSQLDELLSENQKLQEQHQAVLDEKTRALNELTSLRKQTSEMECVIEKLREQNEQGDPDERDSLKSELEMIRKQAESDIKTMKDQLVQSQKKTDGLEQELKTERRRVAELEESSCRPLSLNPAFTAVDGDVFDMVEEDDIKPSNPKQSPKTARSSIGKMVATCLISVVASIAGAGGFLLGTENGRDLLESFLKADSPKQFFSYSKRPETSEGEHPNNTRIDDFHRIPPTGTK